MEKAKSNIAIALFSGLAVGAVASHFASDNLNSSNEDHQSEEVHGVLSPDFQKAIAINESLVSIWTKVTEVDTNEVWIDGTGSILAITHEGRAVQLFSFIDDIYYVDLFEAGEIRLTAELSRDIDRLFVYEETDGDVPWVHFDREFDGVPDQRLQFGVDGSAQEINWSLAPKGESE